MGELHHFDGKTRERVRVARKGHSFGYAWATAPTDKLSSPDVEGGFVTVLCAHTRATNRTGSLQPGTLRQALWVDGRRVVTDDLWEIGAIFAELDAYGSAYVWLEVEAAAEPEAFSE